MVDLRLKQLYITYADLYQKGLRMVGVSGLCIKNEILFICAKFRIKYHLFADTQTTSADLYADVYAHLTFV